MTPTEIIRALRCTATAQTGDEPCASCPFYRTPALVEDLPEELKAQLSCEEWKSCDIDGVALAAADLIERLTAENEALREKVPQWISVEDRLPEVWINEEDDVLVNYMIYSPDFGVDIGSYHAEAKRWVCMGLPCSVTNWMPLPEAPEAD